MTPLQSLGTLFCVVLACWLLARIGYTLRADRAEREWSDIREWHMLHGPADGCLECEDK